MRKVGFTIEEECALCARAQAGDQAALAELMEGFDPLLRTLASKYSRGRGVLDDNLQSARIGAISAVHAFDPKRRKRLCTLIYRCAINSICRSMDQFLTIRLPSSILNSVGKLEAVLERFEGEHGRAPTIEEVAAEMKVSYNVANSLMQLPRHPVSIDATVASASSLPEPDVLSDFIPDDSPTPDELFINKETSQFILAAVDSLPHPDAEIIKRRFGLAPFSHQQSFNEIGKDLNMISQSVHRAEKRALRSLRAKLNDIVSSNGRDLSDEQRRERILNLNSIGWRSYEIASVLEITTVYVFQVLRESGRRSPCSRSA